MRRRITTNQTRRGADVRRIVVALAVLMAACGGGGGVTNDEGSQLTKAVQDYSDAYLGGRAEDAHRLLSKRCQARVSSSTLAAATAEAQRLYGSARMTGLTVDRLEGSLARVTYRYDDPAIDQESEPWAKEDGQWRQDDC